MRTLAVLLSVLLDCAREQMSLRPSKVTLWLLELRRGEKLIAQRW